MVANKQAMVCVEKIPQSIESSEIKFGESGNAILANENIKKNKLKIGIVVAHPPDKYLKSLV